jgi:uncharacterized protein with PQ loop repeat
MTLTSALGVIAGSFGVVMGASPLLQAIRAHQRRSSEDVSLTFLLILMIGGVAWLAYGLALGNAALIIANLAGVTASTTAVLVTIYWRRNGDAPGSAGP